MYRGPSKPQLHARAREHPERTAYDQHGRLYVLPTDAYQWLRAREHQVQGYVVMVRDEPEEGGHLPVPEGTLPPRQDDRVRLAARAGDPVTGPRTEAELVVWEVSYNPRPTGQQVNTARVTLQRPLT